MDLYANKGPAWAQKATITALELLLIGVSAWLMFGGGEVVVAGWLGFAPAASPPLRRAVLLGFNVVVLVRMAFMMFVLMRRTIPWSEAFTVPFAFAIYYVGFALLVLPSRAPLDGLDAVAIGLFVLGSVLNTGSELGRHRFKQQPANQGKLYTSGLFAWSMHVNFFGDIVWVAAYALLTRNPWSALIPVALTLFFALGNVPMLDRHLAERYGKQFEAYAARTKRLIPFAW